MLKHLPLILALALFLAIPHLWPNVGAWMILWGLALMTVVIWWIWRALKRMEER